MSVILPTPHHRTASRRRERDPESRSRRRRTEERRFGVWAAESPDTKPRRTPIKRALLTLSKALFYSLPALLLGAFITRIIFGCEALQCVAERLFRCVFVSRAMRSKGEIVNFGLYVCLMS